MSASVGWVNVLWPRTGGQGTGKGGGGMGLLMEGGPVDHCAHLVASSWLLSNPYTNLSVYRQDILFFKKITSSSIFSYSLELMWVPHL